MSKVKTTLKRFSYLRDYTVLENVKINEHTFDYLMIGVFGILSVCFYDEKICSIARYRRNRVYFTLLSIIAFYGFDKNLDVIDKNASILSLKKNFDLHWKSLVESNLTPLNRKVVMICFRMNYYLCYKFGQLIRKLKR